MRKKHRFLVPLISLLIVAGILAGAFVYWKTRPVPPVHVYNIEECYLFDYYWENSGYTDGVVTSDKLQTVYLSASQEVTAVNVQLGQQVHAGDPILSYDTTLSQLTLERQKLDIERKKLQLQDAKDQLAEINKMKPISYGPATPSTKPTTTTTKPTSGANQPAETLPTSGYLVYGNHAGTKNDPLRIWIRSDLTMSESVIRQIMESAKLTNAWLVFETRENNSKSGAVTNCLGVQVERAAATTTDPTGPGKPEDGPDTDPVQGPETEETKPEETEEPTEPEPEEPTEPEDPGEQGGDEGNDPPPDDEGADAEKPGADENQNTTNLRNSPAQRSNGTVYIYLIRSVFAAHPLSSVSGTSPAPTAPSSGSSINMNSGYTASEISQMKTDKQQEIRELEFAIKMAESEYKIMQKEFDNGVVTAEVDGVVISVLDAEEAMMNNEPIVKISGGGGFTIQGTLSELRLDSVHVGDPVQVECWMSGTYCQGTIVDISEYPVNNQYGYYGDGNPNVSYYPFTVVIDASENLQTGEYAMITFDDAQEEDSSFYMQCSFLRSENGVYYAFVRGEDGLLEKRRLTVGQMIYNGEAIKIISGLTMQDCVSFPYGSGMKEGSPTEQISDISELYGMSY